MSIFRTERSTPARIYVPDWPGTGEGFEDEEEDLEELDEEDEEEGEE